MYIFGQVNARTSLAVIKELHKGTLDKIWLNSQGGDLTAALAIYDAIVGKGVTVIGIGQIASAATIVMLAGDKRFATPNTRFMTHGVYIEKEENPDEYDTKELGEAQIKMASLYVRRGGMSQDRAEELLARTHYFGTSEARDLGFIHGEWSE